MSGRLVSYEAARDFKTTLKMHLLKNIKELCWLRKEDHEDTSSDLVIWCAVCLLFYLLLFCRMKDANPLPASGTGCSSLDPGAGRSQGSSQHCQPGTHMQDLVPLKAQLNFLLLKRWRKPRAFFFHHLLQIQTEKLILLLKMLFLMSISVKNGKKPEKQHSASGNVLWEQPALSLWHGPVGPRWQCNMRKQKKDRMRQ